MSAKLHVNDNKIKLKLGTEEMYLSIIKAMYDKTMADIVHKSFPGGSDGKESACNAGDLGSVPGSGRSPGEGNGNPLQYSCLEDSMDRGA